MTDADDLAFVREHQALLDPSMREMLEQAGIDLTKDVQGDD